jgi:hypothetical protein
MLNFRQPTLRKSFLRLPLRMVECTLSLILTKTSKRIFNHKSLSPLQTELFTNQFLQDSPCFDKWSQMLA